jgi:hypothetical protein
MIRDSGNGTTHSPREQGNGRIAQRENGNVLMRAMRATYLKTGSTVKLFDSFARKPRRNHEEALHSKQTETERQALAVRAQLRLLESEEEKADSHWRLLKKKAPARGSTPP